MPDNWHEEKQSAWLYRIIATGEPDPRIAAMFSALADAAEGQARIWAQQQYGGSAGRGKRFAPSLRARVVAHLLRRFGPRPMQPILAAMKVRGLSVYQVLPRPLVHDMPTQVSEVGARHRGAASGGNLRAAVFGINDGLVSNTCLIMGVAGAGSSPVTILTTGAAGLLAGALSMAAGEYISMRSQREMYESQIALERAELDSYPEEEIEELALIYNARGLSLADARQFARALVRDPEQALNTLAREELGLNPENLGSPWRAAGASFFAFTAGALLPLIPFMFARGTAPLTASAALAAASLFAVGAALSLFTGRSSLWSGVRMVLIGGGAGLATYLIGRLFEVALV